jgi:hypothetical protein
LDVIVIQIEDFTFDVMFALFTRGKKPFYCQYYDREHHEPRADQNEIINGAIRWIINPAFAGCGKIRKQKY